MYKPCILLKISDLLIGDRLIFFKCVIRLGFEPKTHSLEGCCSIQLSYRTAPIFSDAKLVLFFQITKYTRFFINMTYLYYYRTWFSHTIL